MSVPPPAGKHAIMVICRSGYSARASSLVAPGAAIKIITGSVRRRRCAASGMCDMGLSSQAYFIVE
jgi:hypothetical protein